MDRDHRRRFGQNFLEDTMAHAIAHDVELQARHSVLEVGPGEGALSRHILDRCAHLTCVEIDRDCAGALSERLQQSGMNIANLEVVCGDFLQFDIAAWCAQHQPAWFMGNLPYNVATAIVVHLMPNLHKFAGAMVMVQKEVAERLCASAGNSGYGSLSVHIANYAQANILRIVGPEYFSPKPNVDSATVLLSPLSAPLCTDEAFDSFVRQCFRQKRKRLLNCLDPEWPKDLVRANLQAMGLNDNARAEEMPPQVLLQLYMRLQSDSGFAKERLF